MYACVHVPQDILLISFTPLLAVAFIMNYREVIDYAYMYSLKIYRKRGNRKIGFTVHIILFTTMWLILYSAKSFKELLILNYM